MRVLSPTPTSTPHLLDSVASWWSHAIILLSLLLLARATRAQSPDSEQLALGGDASGIAAVSASFAYDGGSRCAGTVGTIAPALALGAAGGTFAASPAGLRLDPTTGVIDLAHSQAGAYTITNHRTSPQGNEAAVASTFLVLNALPSPVLTASGPTTFSQGGSVLLKASGGGPGTTYQFFNNGQTISGAAADTYKATTSGSYTVLAINPGSCVAASAPVAVTVTSTAKQPLQAEAPKPETREARASQPGITLTVFPNPTTGSFTAAISSQVPAQLTVYTTLGEKLETSLLPAISGSCTADLTHLAPGVYILQATTAAGSIKRRVVRE
jgi:hypothetical protein